MSSPPVPGEIITGMTSDWWPTTGYAAGETMGDGRSCVPTTMQAINPPTTRACMATVNTMAIFC